VQRLAPAVELGHGRLGNGVGRIGPVGEATQNAGTDEDGHYSYNPSLLNAASGTDTPQSTVAAKSFRSQSSIATGGSCRRRTSRASASGEMPRRLACTAKADSR